MPLRTALCALCAIAALLLLGPGSAVAGPSENGVKARRPAAPSQVEDMTVGEDVGFVFAVDLGAVPGATYVQVLPGELPAGSRTAPVDSEAAPLPEPAEVQPEALQPSEEAREQPIEEQDFAVEIGPEVTFEEVALRESSGEPAEEPGVGVGEEGAPDRELVELEEIPLHPGAAGDPETALAEPDELAQSDRPGDDEAAAAGPGEADVPEQDEAAASDSGEAADLEPAEPAENPSAELAGDSASHAGDAEAPSSEPAAAAPAGGAASPR